jgi:hypothetical protein
MLRTLNQLTGIAGIITKVTAHRLLLIIFHLIPRFSARE